MAIQRRRVSVPEQEISPTKVPFKNLATVASHSDGANLNFTYEVRTDARGVFIKKREGITVLSSLGAAGTQVSRGGTSWRPSSATTDSLIFGLDNGTNVTLYVDSSGTATTTTQTMTTGKELFFVPISAFDGTTTVQSLLVMNGTDQAKLWTGAGITTGWSATTATPLATAKYGVFYRNMLVVAGTSANKNRLYFSNVGKPDTFTAADALDFPGEITGLHVYENLIMVFTRNNIFHIMGSQPSDIVSSGSARGLLQRGVRVGTDAHRTIARVGDWVYFWNSDRVYRYNGSDLFEVAYPKFQRTLATAVKTLSSQFAAISFGGRYYLSFVYSTGTANNAVAVYDPRPDTEGNPIDEWVLHTSPWAHSFASYRASTDAVPGLVFFTNSATSRVEKVYTYNGSTVPLDFTTAAASAAFTTQYTSEFLDFGDSHLIKKFRYLFFATKGISSTATAQMQVALDFGGYATILSFTMTSGGFTLDSSSLDVDALTDTSYSTTDVKRIQLPAGRSISVRFYDAQGIGQSEFYDFDVQLIPKKLKTK